MPPSATPPYNLIAALARMAAAEQSPIGWETNSMAEVIGVRFKGEVYLRTSPITVMNGIARLDVKDPNSGKMVSCQIELDKHPLPLCFD